jgi:hypothetical protein
VFVDRAAREVLKGKLGGSPFAEEDYLRDMLITFEKKVMNPFICTQSLSLTN